MKIIDGTKNIYKVNSMSSPTTFNNARDANELVKLAKHTRNCRPRRCSKKEINNFGMLPFKYFQNCYTTAKIFFPPDEAVLTQPQLTLCFLAVAV